mmetsp:Transcript_37987/g.41996  ORF Transcript_37987/g.41996 Transcript_37987/m.41996 type:complete len:376 (+) Transcript_37987:242-1369(+)
MPRFSALVSLWCAILLITSILRSKYYRNRIYHRINLGCGLNIILLCVLKLWGSAAEPTNNNIWARGTIATCSISGFLHHIAIFIIPQYYCALSLLSYAAFRNKIRLSNFCRIEKWIHIGVYVFPLAAATYLLTLRAFNPTIHGCSLASIPVGCGDETTTDEELLPCDRGPNNISQLQWLFWGLPSLLFFSIPTVVLFLLCVEVKKNKGTTTKHQSVAISIAKQSSLFILVLFWTYFFRFIDLLTFINFGPNFILNLLANINEALIGLWIYIPYYWYFRRNTFYENTNNTSSTVVNNNNQSKSDLFNDESTTSNEELKSIMSNRNSKWLEQKQRKKNISGKYDSEVFDGSNTSQDSPWASYITEGVDDDYDYEGRM